MERNETAPATGIRDALEQADAALGSDEQTVWVCEARESLRAALAQLDKAEVWWRLCVAKGDTERFTYISKPLPHAGPGWRRVLVIPEPPTRTVEPEGHSETHKEEPTDDRKD